MSLGSENGSFSFFLLFRFLTSFISNFVEFRDGSLFCSTISRRLLFTLAFGEINLGLANLSQIGEIELKAISYPRLISFVVFIAYFSTPSGLGFALLYFWLLIFPTRLNKLFWIISNLFNDWNNSVNIWASFFKFYCCCFHSLFK